MQTTIQGLNHVAAIESDQQRNHDSYIGGLVYGW